MSELEPEPEVKQPMSTKSIVFCTAGSFSYMASPVSSASKKGQETVENLSQIHLRASFSCITLNCYFQTSVSLLC